MKIIVARVVHMRLKIITVILITLLIMWCLSIRYKSNEILYGYDIYTLLQVKGTISDMVQLEYRPDDPLYRSKFSDMSERIEMLSNYANYSPFINTASSALHDISDMSYEEVCIKNSTYLSQVNLRLGEYIEQLNETHQNKSRYKYLESFSREEMKDLDIIFNIQ